MDLRLSSLGGNSKATDLGLGPSVGVATAVGTSSGRKVSGWRTKAVDDVDFNVIGLPQSGVEGEVAKVPSPRLSLTLFCADASARRAWIPAEDLGGFRAEDGIEGSELLACNRSSYRATKAQSAVHMARSGNHARLVWRDHGLPYSASPVQACVGSYWNGWAGA